MSEAIGRRVAAARQKLGLSQTDLSQKTGIAQTQISRYESGRAVPRRASMQALSEALGVGIDWLMHGESALLPSPLTLQLKLAEDDVHPQELVIPGVYVDFVRNVAERLNCSVADAVVEIIKRYMVEIAFASTGNPKVPHLGALVTEYTDLELRVQNLTAELDALKKDLKIPPDSENSSSL